MSQLSDFLEFLQNNAWYNQNTKTWEMPDKLNNGKPKAVSNTIVIMGYLRTKVR